MTAAAIHCIACGAALAPNQWHCPECGRPDAAGTTMGAPQLSSVGAVGDKAGHSRHEARQATARRPADSWASPAPDGPAMPDPSQVLRPPPSRRAVRRAVAVIAGAAAIAAGLIVLNDRLFTPGQAAKRYFAALEARDFGAARGRLERAATEEPLIDSAMLPQDGYTPPAGAHVDNVQLDDNGSGATARVSFTVGGESAISTVRLVLSGRRLLIFPRWRVQDQYTISVAAPSGADVQIAGIQVSANEPVPAFPGAYQVGLADNPLLETDPVTAYALQGAPSATLAPRVKPQARAEVGKQINDLLSRCSRTADLAPSGCPFGATSDDPVTEVRWRILSKPTPTVEQSEDGVEVVTSQEGQVELTGLGENSDGSQYPVAETFSYSVNGPVTVENGAVQWQLQR